MKILLLIAMVSMPAFAGDGAVWDAKCKSCHGEDGKGKAAMAKALKLEAADLDMTKKATLDKSDAELVKITRMGHGKMPGYEKKLDAGEIAAVVAYMRGLAGGGDGAEAPGPGKAVYLKKCASCHAADGSGNEKMAKVFKVEPAALSLISKEAVKAKDEDLRKATAEGRNKMPAYGKKLDEKEIDALVEYMRALQKKAAKK